MTRRLLSAALALALVLPAPGTAAALGGVVARPVPAAPVAPVLGAAAAAPVPPAASPLPSGFAAPALTLPLPAPGLPAAKAGTAAASAAAPRAAAATAAAPASRAAAPLAAQAASRPTNAPDAPPAAVPAAASAAEAAESAARAEGSSERAALGRAAKSLSFSPEAASSALFDGSAARAPLSAVKAEEPAPRPGRARGLAPALKRGAAAAALVLGLRLAIPVLPAVQQNVGFWQRALDVVGRAGYWAGNALAFVFAVPQIYKTFRDGSAGKTPVWRAMVGAGASLALGLVSAPLARQAFWGIQNTFGGLTLLAPLLIGAVLAKRGWKFTARKAAALTAATAALLFAPAFAFYAAAAEVVPSGIEKAFGAAGAGAVALTLQIATGAAFFLLFVPDIVAIVKGRAPKGFTSMFSMLFFLASAGFIAWTLQMAADAAPGSPERVQFLVYAAQNAAYAVVSFLSWLFIRRAEKKAAGAKS